ncbi:MAG TPA: DoxX family protein [Longimicrobiales bacterium]|nr:DoxX family protein [Longimicrobiales bacterium]
MNALFGRTSERQLDTGLAVLRAVVGIIFIMHGGQKLFVYGLDGVSGGFAQMGVPLAGVMGPLVGFVEFFGGIALVLGLLTRLASAGLAFVMVGAILLVHLPAGFFAPDGYEFPLSLLGASVLLALAGAGGYSVDAVIGRRMRRDTVQVTDRPAPVRRAA